jgi:hypothetical protein
MSEFAPRIRDSVVTKVSTADFLDMFGVPRYG